MKMDKVKCNKKENEIVTEENEESCGLTFSLQDLGQLSMFQERWQKLQKQPPESL